MQTSSTPATGSTRTAITAGARLRTRPPAFTLVELLVAIGIIGALIGTLIPTVGAAQREARALQCQGNVRTLALALMQYATDNRGRFPPNRTAPAPALTWADEARLGKYVALPPAGPVPGESPYVCPDDKAGARRSYAMNVWASSKVDKTVLTQTPTRGRLWRLGDARPSELVLLTEAWSYQGAASTGFRSAAAVGVTGNPGNRFGGAGGLPPFTAGRFGRVNCELDYRRHRKARGEGVQPVGRLTIAFGDGHVELRTNDSLVDASTGALTGSCYWSPLDAPR